VVWQGKTGDARLLYADSSSARQAASGAEQRGGAFASGIDHGIDGTHRPEVAFAMFEDLATRDRCSDIEVHRGPWWSEKPEAFSTEHPDTMPRTAPT
jgi:hypothetical protein